MDQPTKAVVFHLEARLHLMPLSLLVKNASSSVVKYQACHYHSPHSKFQDFFVLETSRLSPSRDQDGRQAEVGGSGLDPVIQRLSAEKI